MITICSVVYKKLTETVGTLPPETGAIIGSLDATPNDITLVWFDRKDPGEYYIPSFESIAGVVKKWKLHHKASFCGIVHSHHIGYPDLSRVDLRSAGQIIRSNNMDSLLLGVFHGKELFMFRITIVDGEAQSEKVEYTVIEQAKNIQEEYYV